MHGPSFRCEQGGLTLLSPLPTRTTLGHYGRSKRDSDCPKAEQRECEQCEGVNKRGWIYHNSSPPPIPLCAPQAMHGGGPPLSTSDFCSTCLTAQLRHLSLMEEARDIRALAAELLANDGKEAAAAAEQPAPAAGRARGGRARGGSKERSALPPKHDDTYFVSKTWLQGE